MNIAESSNSSSALSFCCFLQEQNAKFHRNTHDTRKIHFDFTFHSMLTPAISEQLVGNQHKRVNYRPSPSSKTNFTKQLNSPIYLYSYIGLFINWFIKHHKVVTSEAPFLARDGRNHLQDSLYLPMEDGQAEWAWINTGMEDLPKVIINPRTNWAQHSSTLLMWQTLLPLCQTSHNVPQWSV